MRHTFLLVTLAVAVVGCSDPKAANEKNFKVAIQSYLDVAYPKCYVLQQFPYSSDFDIGGIKPRLQALAKVGLVSEKETERKEVRDIFSAGGKRLIVKSSFDLTDEGRKYYKTDVAKSLMGTSMGGFCFGKATVKAVTQFSEPADMFGEKISKVNYEYTVSDLPEWTKSPEIQAVVNGLKTDVQSSSVPVKALDAVVLTNNGWVHEKLFRK